MNDELLQNLLSCTRCGACLPVCPTYNATIQEVQSPRGRVALITAVQDGRIRLSRDLASHMYHCLDCRACQTACPSGVRVGELVLEARAAVHDPPLSRWIKRLILRGVLRSHRTVRFAFLPLALYQNLGIRRLAHRLGLIRILPRRLRELEAGLPRIPFTRLLNSLPHTVPASNACGPRVRVGLFLGCVMSAVFADVSRATVRVLSALGCEVVTPKAQRCCGAPHTDQGDHEAALSLAQHNITTFERAGVDVVVADCAACSAMLKEYSQLLQDHPTFAERAAAFSRKVMDINEFLAQRIPDRTRLREVRKLVTYHSPCHLAHAQGICSQPRAVLTSIPGISLVEMREAEWCCGSAGAYVLTHPQRSSQLLDRKMRNVRATGAEVIVTSNPGCILQLAVGCRRSGIKAEVRHVVEIVDQALSGPGETCRVKRGARDVEDREAHK